MVKIEDVNIVVSYVREDGAFVRHVASMLRHYTQKDKVFTYLDEKGVADPRINNALGAIGQLLEECKPKEGTNAPRVPVFVQFTRNDGSISPAQLEELNAWNAFRSERGGAGQTSYEFKVVLPPSADPLGKGWSVPHGMVALLHDPAMGLELKPLSYDLASAEWIAESILRRLMFDQQEIPFDSQLSNYEKDVIGEFRDIMKERFCARTEEERHDLEERLKAGFPLAWPTVSVRTDLPLSENRAVTEEQVGTWRKGLPDMRRDGNQEEPDAVVACALTSHHDPCMMKMGLTFLEAGPRQNVLNRPGLQVGVLVSGGIAPGINAVIDGIVRRHKRYGRARVIGIRHGFFGLLNWDSAAKALSSDETSRHATEGGTILETHRLQDLLNEDIAEQNEILDRILDALKVNRISILYIIGGDGSMKAAHLLTRQARMRGLKISVVGVPKTMDNDILWVWQSFGFATAVQKAGEIIRHLYTELSSNPRVCFLQLFGSSSGFVVSHAVSASQTGQCDIALIPEGPFTIRAVAERLAKRIAGDDGRQRVRTIPYGMVIMAETAIPEDWKNHKALLTEEEVEAVASYHADRKKGQYPPGQTSDLLRSAGLKLVRDGAMREMRNMLKAESIPNPLDDFIYDDEDVFRAFSNEPRHILRATEPSFADIIMGQRLGSLAVDNAMAGYTDFMISQWLTEYVLVPLRLVSMGRKRIPQEGIFWKSVLEKTGQGPLIDPDSTG